MTPRHRRTRGGLPPSACPAASRFCGMPFGAYRWASFRLASFRLASFRLAAFRSGSSRSVAHARCDTAPEGMSLAACRFLPSFVAGGEACCGAFVPGVAWVLRLPAAKDLCAGGTGVGRAGGGAVVGTGGTKGVALGAVVSWIAVPARRRSPRPAPAAERRSARQTGSPPVARRKHQRPPESAAAQGVIPLSAAASRLRRGHGALCRCSNGRRRKSTNGITARGRPVRGGSVCGRSAGGAVAFHRRHLPLISARRFAAAGAELLSTSMPMRMTTKLTEHPPQDARR